MNVLTDMAERAWLPDPLIRLGIRRLNRMRLRGESLRQDTDRKASIERFARMMRQDPIAMSTNKANDQHYEVPAGFFQQVLGKHLKYSSALWLPDVTDLDRAEADMLALTARRAGLSDGMQILELGCGWGSLTLRWKRQLDGASLLHRRHHARRQPDLPI
jgi:cyclopropane-fatty-acyl-phospholipid synthase